MSRALCALLAIGLTASRAGAVGPHEGGTLLIHADPSLVYSEDANYCGQSSYEAGNDPVVTKAAGDPFVLHALALFPPGSSPGLAGVSFGIEYTAGFRLLAHGHCGDFELSDSSWPDSGTGTALTWLTDQTEEVVEVYWFAAYAEGPGPHRFTLRPHPTLGGNFADRSVPSIQDPIADYGALGIGTYGYSPVARLRPLARDLEPGGIDIRFVPGEAVIDAFPDPRAAYAIEGVRTSDPILRDSLYAIGAVSMQKAFPTREPGDTLQQTVAGDWIVVPDLSVYYRVTTDSPAGDSLHARSLARVPSSVRFAQHWVEDPEAGIPQTVPNDPYFDSWGSQQEDMQWHLKNDGVRSISYCGDAVPGMDVRVADLAEWLEYADQEAPVVVGIADVGIWNGHEDYDVIAEWNIGEDTHDYCGDHGTIVAGAAAARTDNSVGIASVCPDCPIFDIDLHRESADCENGAGSTHCDPFGTAVIEAMDRNLGEGPHGLRRKLGAISNATGCGGSVTEIAALYEAYARGVVPVLAARYIYAPGPHAPVVRQWPQCAPFIVTTGGFDWKGDFLDIGANCNNAIENGLRAGPQAIRISAPASGRSLSTHLAHVNDGYSNTMLGTSCASGMVNGAIALLQSIYSEGTQPPQEPMMVEARHMIGMLTASALPYGSDPAANPDRLCPDCVTTDYGPGRINIEGAKILMDFWKRFPWQSSDEYWALREVDWHSPGARFHHERRIETPDGEVYNVWALSVPVTIAPYDDEQAIPLPRFVAFPFQGAGQEHAPDFTSTFLFAEGPTDAHQLLSLDMAYDGVRGCELTIDQSDGSASLQGYVFSRFVNNTDYWLVEPTEAKMYYFEFRNPYPSNVDPPAGGTLVPGAWVRGTPGPGPFTLELGLPRAQTVSVTIHDAGGRLVRSLHDGPTPQGRHELVWDRLDDRGRRVPVGAYFAMVRAEDFERTPKFIVLSR